MSDARSLRVEGQPLRRPAGVVLGMMLIACDLLFLAVHWAFSILGLPLLALGVLIIGWQISGREAVTVDGGMLVIESRTARSAVTSRSYDLSQIANPAAHSGVFWLARSASGLPLAFAAVPPTIRFVYDGQLHLFGQTFDARQQDLIVRHLKQSG